VSKILLTPFGNKMFSLSVTTFSTPLLPLTPFAVVLPLVCGTFRVSESASKGASMLATERPSNNGKRA